MGRDVRVLTANPDAETVDTDDGRWIFSGLQTETLREAVRDAGRPKELRERLPEVAEDATAIYVESGRGEPRVEAYRSVTGTRDIYYLRDESGDLVVTDHFRNALAELDVDERKVSDEVVTDHLLFRAPIEPRTYATRVHALEQGGWLRWDGTNDEWQTEQVGQIEPGSPCPPGVASASIDATLDDLVSRGCDSETANMLSGGIDSTLLHTYLDDAPAFIMGVDSPEFAFETEYAERARRMLDTDHRKVTVGEDDFLSHLEASVDALGFPSHYAQTVTTDAALRRDDGYRYLNGEGADALFGLTGTKGLRIAAWLEPLLSEQVADSLSDVAPDAVAGQYSSLARLADRLDRPVTDSESFAQHLSFFTEPSLAGEFVGESLVADRFRKQAEYVRRRITPTANGDRFARQAEFGHLLSFLRHNTVNQWRQLGYEHDRSFFTPFKTQSMAECALSVPAEKRYIQGATAGRDLTQKYHLKSLLQNRLPEYPTRQKKGSGSLPIERYFEEGALADIFERYDAPNFVPERMRSDHVESYGPLTWNLITFAVWRDRILDNPDLATVSGSRQLA